MELSTSDFYFTCYLTLSGEEIKSIRKLNNNKLEFIFDDPNRFMRLKENFFWNKAKVDPLAFSNQIKKIKTIIYNN